MITTIFFGLSFVAVFGLIGFKAFENYKGSLLFLASARKKTDESFLYFVSRVRHEVVGFLGTLRLRIWHFLEYRLRFVVSVVIKKLSLYYSCTADMIRGKHVLRSRGSVSFFLKHIAEHKNNARARQ